MIKTVDNSESLEFEGSHALVANLVHAEILHDRILNARNVGASVHFTPKDFEFLNDVFTELRTTIMSELKKDASE